MKRCYRCKIDKPLSEFHRNARRADGLQSECKACRSDRHTSTWPARRVRQVELSAAQRARLLAKLNALKARPCMDCGGSFPPYVMDFDHRDPATKIGPVSRLLYQGLGWSKIVAEVAKCDLGCANCHRIRTHNRGAVPERPLVQPAKL